VDPKILLIAPNKDLADYAEKVLLESKKCFEIKVGDLENGVRMAQKAEKEGYEAIISRGGTYMLIKQAVSLPAVEISISSFDILQSINKAMAVDHKLAVVGFPNAVYGTSSLERLLGIKLYEYHVQDQKSAKEIMQKIKDADIRVVVGDTVSVKAAQEAGLQGIIISSGKRAIYEALEETERLVAFRRTSMEENNRLKALLSLVSEGVIAVDQIGRIIHFSPAAEEVTGLQSTSVVGMLLQKVLPRVFDFCFSQDGNTEKIMQIAGNQIFVRSAPVQINNKSVGVVATFNRVSDIQEVESKVRLKLLSKGHLAKAHFKDIVGNSDAIKKTISKAKKYSQSNSTVVLYGETGVGKELFAQGIHNHSSRKNKPFIAINCAALPESILESELFGYVEGSFTDARKGGKTGLFELSHKGTIFLDEVAEMSLKVQAKLLRVLQEKEVSRLGDDKVIPVDIRVIAATNKDLWYEVSQGNFREDLYYRINVLPLTIPPLRERKKDILALAKYFLNEIGPSVQAAKKAFDSLMEYSWPGNVRELKNFIEQLVVLAEGKEITVELVRDALQQIIASRHGSQPAASGKGERPPNMMSDEDLVAAILQTGGNLTRTAELLGISRTTLWRRLKKWQQH